MSKAKKNRKKRQLAGLRVQNARLAHRSQPAGLPEDAQECRRDLTCRSYSVRAETFDKKTRSIEAVIATEERVLVYDMCRWEVVEEILLMEGVIIPESRQVPYCDTHMRYTIQTMLGSTREMRVENKRLIGRNFCATTAEGDRALALLEGGHLTDNSIGYRVINSVTIDPDKSANVNGRDFKASPTRALRVTTEWEVRENSACPIGADGAAKNRTEEIRNSNKNREDTNMDFKLWLQKRGLNFDELSETVRAALQIDFDAEQQRTSAPPVKAKAPATVVVPATDGGGARTEGIDLKAVRKEGAADEQKRCKDINEAAGKAGAGAELIKRCIDESMTVDQARAAFLDDLQGRTAAKVGGVTIAVVGATDLSRDLIADALLIRAGFGDILLAETDGEQRASQADAYRDMALMEVFRYAIQLDGGAVPMGKDEIIRAAVSTSSLPIILGAVHNKSLMKGFNAVDPTWMKWCGLGSASDFKTMTRVLLTEAGGFTELGAGGELKKGQMTEEKEQYAITTQAKMDKLTREDIINDDLSVLTKKPMRLGAQGRRRVGELVYAHLLGNPTMGDNKVLFIAAHKNLNTGKALNETNLQYAITQFRKQVDKAGKPIKVSPKYLVVPPELEFTGRKLLESTEIFIKGDTDGVAGNKNVLNGLLQLVVEESLSNASYTGHSATSWYLSADPVLTDTVEVGFLNGRQEPTVNTYANIPGFLGVHFDAYLDVGVKALSWRGLQKNNA